MEYGFLKLKPEQVMAPNYNLSETTFNELAEVFRKQQMAYSILNFCEYNEGDEKYEEQKTFCEKAIEGSTYMYTMLRVRYAKAYDERFGPAGNRIQAVRRSHAIDKMLKKHYVLMYDRVSGMEPNDLKYVVEHPEEFLDLYNQHLRLQDSIRANKQAQEELEELRRKIAEDKENEKKPKQSFWENIKKFFGKKEQA